MSQRRWPHSRHAAAAVLTAAAAALLVPVVVPGGQNATTGASATGDPPRVVSAPAAPREGVAPATGAVLTAVPGVPQSPPVRIDVPQIDLTASIEPYTAADVAAAGGAVRPPDLWTVSWWTGGGTPGTDADNTVYLYGHTWREPAVLNRVGELVAGDEIVVTTVEGRLTYTVEDVFTVDKPELPDNPAVTAVVPGRLLLIGCHRETGDEQTTTRNVVVQARLTAGQA